MLSICRFVPVENGHGELQELERFREVDVPNTGPSEATERQKDALDQALKAVGLEDHDSSSGGQLVLVSSTGRIVAVEIVEKHGRPRHFMWIPQSSEGLPEVPFFMCEERASFDNQMSPSCFELTDSQGRSWHCYQVAEGLLDSTEFPEKGGLRHCQRGDLPAQLSQE